MLKNVCKVYQNAKMMIAEKFSNIYKQYINI